MNHISVAKCETLKQLDLTVYQDGAALIELEPFGDVEVRKSLAAGYVAELKEAARCSAPPRSDRRRQWLLLALKDVLESGSGTGRESYRVPGTASGVTREGFPQRRVLESPLSIERRSYGYDSKSRRIRKGHTGRPRRCERE